MYDFRKSFSYTVYHNWSHLVSASQMGLPCAVPLGLSPITISTVCVWKQQFHILVTFICLLVFSYSGFIVYKSFFMTCMYEKSVQISLKDY